MGMLLRVTALTLLVSGAASAPPRQPTYVSLQPPPGSESMCVANGDYYREGTRACVRSAYGPQIATCGKVQNVLNWEMSGTRCEAPPPKN